MKDPFLALHEPSLGLHPTPPPFPAAKNLSTNALQLLSLFPILEGMRHLLSLTQPKLVADCWLLKSGPPYYIGLGVEAPISTLLPNFPAFMSLTTSPWEMLQETPHA